jgi:hypothetical protein
MNLDSALLIIANTIWDKGETDFVAQGCLFPSSFVTNDKINNYHLASDFLADNMGYTHYSRKWDKKGKSVLLEFYCAEGFGAYDINELQFKEKYIVKI